VDVEFLPWNDEQDEYEVLTALILPAAQAEFERSQQDWDALDTKAFGLLALVGGDHCGTCCLPRWHPCSLVDTSSGLCRVRRAAHRRDLAS
jgi:hypothetical protein